MADTNQNTKALSLRTLTAFLVIALTLLQTQFVSSQYIVNEGYIENKYNIRQFSNGTWRAYHLNGSFVKQLFFPSAVKKYAFSVQQRPLQQILIYQKEGSRNVFSYHSFVRPNSFSINNNFKSYQSGLICDSKLFFKRNSSIFEKYIYTITYVLNITKDYTSLGFNFSTLACFGSYVYAGTNNGLIFVLDTNLNIISNFSSTDASNVTEIKVLNQTILFAGHSTGKIVQINISNKVSLQQARTYVYHTNSITSFNFALNNGYLISTDNQGIMSQLRIDDWQIYSKHVLNNSNYQIQRVTDAMVVASTSPGPAGQYLNHLITLNQTKTNEFSCTILNCIQCTNGTICIQCNQNATISTDKSACIIPGQQTNKTDPQPTPQPVPQPTPQVQQELTANQTQHTFISILKNRQFVDNFTIFYQTPLIRKGFTACYMLFLNMDQFWLYQYHKRTHGKYMKQVFNFIRQIEKQKWSMIHIQHIENLTQYIISKLQNNSAYSDKTFFEVQKKQNGFFANSLQFFIENIPLNMAAFLAVKIIFHLIKKYKFSKLIRPFSFMGYYFVIISTGNLLFLTYISFNQCKMMFSFSYQNKFTLLVWGIAFFLIIFFSSASSFIFLYTYQKLAKYFIDNQFRIPSTFLFLAIQMSVRNTLLALIHSHLIQNSKLQMLCLVVTQVLFVILVVWFWTSENIFISQTLASLKVLNHSFIVVINSLLLFQTFYTDQQSQAIRNATQQILLLSFILLVANSFLFGLYSIFQLIKDGVPACHKFLKQRQEKQQEKDQKIEQPKKLSLNQNNYQKIQKLSKIIITVNQVTNQVESSHKNFCKTSCLLPQYSGDNTSRTKNESKKKFRLEKKPNQTSMLNITRNQIQQPLQDLEFVPCQLDCGQYQLSQIAQQHKIIVKSRNKNESS